MGINSSAFGARRLPKRGSGKPFGAPAGADLLFPVGSDAPTAARVVGLAVPRGVHTFLSMAKEKYAKESQRHGDYGKKALIAHFDGGARNVARNGSG